MTSSVQPLIQPQLNYKIDNQSFFGSLFVLVFKTMSGAREHGDPGPLCAGPKARAEERKMSEDI